MIVGGKKESVTQELKRKAAEKELKDIRNQRQVLNSVFHSLDNDADKCSEMAEGKAGTKMAKLTTNPTLFRKDTRTKKQNFSKGKK